MRAACPVQVRDKPNLSDHPTILGPCTPGGGGGRPRVLGWWWVGGGEAAGVGGGWGCARAADQLTWAPVGGISPRPAAAGCGRYNTGGARKSSSSRKCRISASIWWRLPRGRRITRLQQPVGMCVPSKLNSLNKECNVLTLRINITLLAIFLSWAIFFTSRLRDFATTSS